MLYFFSKGGFLMYPILLGSIVGVAILISKFIQYRKILRELEIPLDDIIENKIKPTILAPILEGLKNNCDEKEASIIGTKQIRRIEKGLSWLALIASIVPLLGLTGTVTGMIKAFIVIEKSTSVNPSMLAGGIWEALITTAAGLMVAVLIHIGHHYLENRADDIAFLLKEITNKLYMRERNGI
ncbi:MAG TPA: MotA/TolQ/ExbB proton channel family protein [Desulfurella acetivorans]|uniref:MotA/TolQ/ExbB proton channel family protein n=1 Tax=Desulfurella acetivorans TaxID=33002 RepID=A0A7C6EBA1_DESAE|nr:MotA/TolQ/ExbB proton channel family protein [Desulfurella acetivorans]